MVQVPVYGGHFALIDDQFLPLVTPYKWYIYKNKAGNVYAQGYHPITKARIQMQRLIMGVTKSTDWVDHKNKNGLDNQLSNLRLCTPGQNNAHRRARWDGTSKYLGVQRSGKYKWQANIRKDNKNHYLGTFEIETDAALAYNENAKVLHGEFASLNQI